MGWRVGGLESRWDGQRVGWWIDSGLGRKWDGEKVGWTEGGMDRGWGGMIDREKNR